MVMSWRSGGLPFLFSVLFLLLLSVLVVAVVLSSLSGVCSGMQTPKKKTANRQRRSRLTAARAAAMPPLSLLQANQIKTRRLSHVLPR